MSRPSRLGDWLTLLGLVAIGLLLNAIVAALGLFLFELLGLWPISEDVGSTASRGTSGPSALGWGV